jgi:hypothetical protein
MKRRRRICVALSATVVLSAAGAALAATVTPPAGTPNMAAMVLQPSDLAAGAVAGREGYAAAPAGFTAQYDGTFTTASTPDGISYYAIGDFVAIAPSAATASAFVASETRVFRSKAGHKLLDAVIISAAGKKAHLKARDIKYESLGSIGVGQGSFAETIGLHVKHVSVHEDVVLFGQGTTYAFLIMTARPGEKVPTSDATALAGAIDAHITSVLGATGSTGTTGATGST